MRFHIIEYITLSLSRTVFQLSLRIYQIIAFDMWVPLVNVLVLGNFFDYLWSLSNTRQASFHRFDAVDFI